MNLIYRCLLLLVCLVLLASCRSRKPDELNYLQNAEAIALQASRAYQSEIRTGDQLQITVSARDMEVVRPFNRSYYSSQNPLSNKQPVTTAPENIYTVLANNTIDFPVLGRIATAGQTAEDLQRDLTRRIAAYVKNPVVTVQLVNFRITVLGEVEKPGQYTVTDVNPTLLNALGLAGDLTMYGRRDNILVVRNTAGQPEKQRLDLTDASFLQSPFYQLRQGDVIYVSANDIKQKAARQDPNTSVYIAVAGTLIGLAGIFITIFKK